ncbi:hypothetical protein [Streptomyces sp. SCSIO 30461]|uniref:hypothetical protein n=1 Tax=Streptomyces sp. SCSIO 30461 TaxID=3118085 RepID=UPI00387E7951
MDEEAVPGLRVEGAAAAVAWYQRLGFAKQREHRGRKGVAPPPSGTQAARP